jgi:hypothetical protein
MSAPNLRIQRLPTFYPSAASCVDESPGGNGSALGACMRAQYYRCRGYDKTDPSGLYSEYIFAAGNIWENWLSEITKEMGIWAGNNIKFQDIERNISGEIDILIRDPDTKELMIVENKTYSSSNYTAKKDICGSRAWRGSPEKLPKPKDSNLMQSFLYLGHFGPQGIKKTLLTYIDRAAGGPENNKQFTVEVAQVEDKRRPKITVVDADGVLRSWVDNRISLEGIYDRYAELKRCLIADTVPSPDYAHEYSSEKVQAMSTEGLIAKTKLEKYDKNPSDNPIGDWQCAWCDYKTLCKAHQEDGI